MKCHTDFITYSERIWKAARILQQKRAYVQLLKKALSFDSVSCVWTGFGLFLARVSPYKHEITACSETPVRAGAAERGAPAQRRDETNRTRKGLLCIIYNLILSNCQIDRGLFSWSRSRSLWMCGWWWKTLLLLSRRERSTALCCSWALSSDSVRQNLFLTSDFTSFFLITDNLTDFCSLFRLSCLLLICNWLWIKASAKLISIYNLIKKVWQIKQWQRKY